MAYVLIGGTAVGTVLTLAFLPALYAIWFRVRHVDVTRATMIKPALPVAGRQ
jgi:Cu/Ag efflux pump CusA